MPAMACGFESRHRHHMNRGRNLELKNEISKFRPLFLCRKPRIQATFPWSPSFVEIGHSKRKMEKLKCKNEKESNPNPEFSYFCGFLFFDPVILLCLFRSFILQGGMRAFSIVEGDKMGDSPHQIRFRRIMPAVQFFLFENGKERFRNRIVMGASCP